MPEPGIGAGLLMKKWAFADAKSEAANTAEMLLAYILFVVETVS
jgi:hypothetical protein